MRLVNLNIKKLHGCYNYNVKFNTDVTFIYGANGCGKTTFLNITEAVISGELFKLFNYQFEEVKLGYAKSENLNDIKYIVIKLKKSNLDIEFNNQNYNIEIDGLFESMRFSKGNLRNITEVYFKRYNFLFEIKNTFNYVCLTLNCSNILYGYGMGVQKFHLSHNFLDKEPAVSQSENLIYNEQLRKSIEIFKSIINEFIGDSVNKKRIKIDTMGKIFFTTKYSKDKIKVQHLSSGEKRLIVFFANLIFNVRNNLSGIFVIDEPELSLHLSWQKIFVEKVLEVNNNIQLIFATHAPEIIGKNRSKIYKLESEYVF